MRGEMTNSRKKIGVEMQLLQVERVGPKVRELPVLLRKILQSYWTAGTLYAIPRRNRTSGSTNWY